MSSASTNGRISKDNGQGSLLALVFIIKLLSVQSCVHTLRLHVHKNGDRRSKEYNELSLDLVRSRIHHECVELFPNGPEAATVS